MIYIALIAVAGILLLQFSGAVPMSSVGGPMTIAVVIFAAALAVAIHEAWTNKRGVIGWIVNIPVAFVGTFLGAEVGNLILEPVLMKMNLQGSLAETRGPLLYIDSAAMMLIALLGSWLALQFVNRWR